MSSFLTETDLTTTDENFKFKRGVLFISDYTNITMECVLNRIFVTFPYLEIICFVSIEF
jgi:hypothetical protein